MTGNKNEKAARPRDRLVREGPQSLSDAELLAVLINPGARQVGTADEADRIIREFGGLRELLTASASAFCAAPGLGEARYAQARAALEIANRYFARDLGREGVLSTPQDAAAYLQGRLGHYPHEVFACVFLDSRNRILQYEELFHGTLTGAALKPREVARRALAHNASGVVPAHNRPTGTPVVGDQDHQVCLMLKDALGLLDVRLVDYVVVGDREAVSLAEQGWI